MKNLAIYDPMREMLSLRSVIDDVFENLLSNQPNTLSTFGYPKVNMVQTDKNVIVDASLPGVKPEDVKITITDQILTIQGEIIEEKSTENGTVHIQERQSGKFSRSIQLPVPVVVEKTTADLKNGVLVITLPKAAEVLPNIIKVNAK